MFLASIFRTIFVDIEASHQALTMRWLLSRYFLIGVSARNTSTNIPLSEKGVFRLRRETVFSTLMKYEQFGSTSFLHLARYLNYVY